MASRESAHINANGKAIFINIDLIAAMVVETLTATDADTAANGLGATPYSFVGKPYDLILRSEFYAYLSK